MKSQIIQKIGHVLFMITIIGSSLFADSLAQTATDPQDAALTAISTTTTANLLTNGNFSNGSANWCFYVTSPAYGSISYSSGTGKVLIDCAGTQTWHIQLYQTINVTAGCVYSYSFTARKLNPGIRTINFVVEDNVSPYNRDVDRQISINETTKTVTGTFTATTSRTARIEIMAGLSDLDFEVDNFSVTKGYKSPEFKWAYEEQNVNSCLSYNGAWNYSYSRWLPDNPLVPGNQYNDIKTSLTQAYEGKSSIEVTFRNFNAGFIDLYLSTNPDGQGIEPSGFSEKGAPKDISTYDALRFFVKTVNWQGGAPELSFDLIETPFRNANPVRLSEYVKGVSLNEWTEVRIPLKDMCVATTDLKRIVEIRIRIESNFPPAAGTFYLDNVGFIDTRLPLIDIDGNAYRTVRIGNQEWTAENISTTHYNDGSPIPLVTSNTGWCNLTTPAYCWYNNDIANKATYGALYNWEVVNTGKLAPPGWHVPTDADWSLLTAVLGGADVAGGKLKEAGLSHWIAPNTGATNASGFSALPGCYRIYYNGKFFSERNCGFWWSATEHNATFAYYRPLYSVSDDMVRDYWYKGAGFSVRLVRDLPAVSDIEGNIYATVQIGNQIWTLENLKTTRLNDGTAIPLIEDNAQWNALASPGYCWYDNDLGNRQRYGALYNWYTVSSGKLAPAGWHVPTDAEWKELENFCVANRYNWDSTMVENRIAQSVAAKTVWEASSNPGTPGSDLTENNRTGFSALPGGRRNSAGFMGSGTETFWWINTENDATSAFIRYLHYEAALLNWDYDDKSCGFSVRLVKDK
jgi:uncharacterized protein (TIGR02145 family)